MESEIDMMANKVFLTSSDFIMESSLKDSILLPYSGGELDEELETDLFLDALKEVSQHGESTEDVQDYKIKDVKLYLDVPNDYNIGFDGSIISAVDIVIGKPRNKTKTDSCLVKMPVILKNKKEFFEAFITGGCRGLAPRYADLLRDVITKSRNLKQQTKLAQLSQIRRWIMRFGPHDEISAEAVDKIWGIISAEIGDKFNI